MEYAMATILLLEDSPAIRRIVVSALSDRGHDVVECENGFAAYDTALLNSIDLMITDLVMPRVDGLEAIRTARNTRTDLRIIAMSAGCDRYSQDYLEVARVFGAHSIMQKPFEPDHLVELVDSALAA